MVNLPTVHMIWLGSPLPKKYLKNIQTYRRLGYEVKLWTKPLPGMVNRDIFDAMTTWAGKADVMRLEILYREGGLYTDTDSFIKRRLPINSGLVVMTSASGYMANETIYAKKGHPALKEAIDGMQDNIDSLSKKGFSNIWEICGATYITPIFEKYPHTKLPRSMIGKRGDRPRYIQHSYDGSWSEGISKAEPKPLRYWLSDKQEERTMKIPKVMHTIWIGDDSKRPDHLLKTWQDKHPDWEYKIWGNNQLYGRRWKNQSLIDVYLKEERYPGVADAMRYEILYEEGGFLHPADSECLHNVEPLLDQSYDAYAVYENEKVRPGLTSPLYACSKGNLFAKALIDNLPKVPPKALRGNSYRSSKAPWQVTGNAYMRRMIAAQNYPKLMIWPSYRFNPIHHTGETYKGQGKVYAVQKWGTTTEAGIGVRRYSWGNR